MVEVRVDEGGLYAIGGVEPPVRVDQGGMYALAGTVPQVRVDQGGLLALVAITPEMRVDQAGMYCLAYGSPCGTRWAQIWTITRTDDEVFRFTSLDRDLEYGGNTYQACDSLVPSASEAVSEVGELGSMDLSGAIGTITEHALYSGLFDGAKVEAWLVPWDGEGMPRRLLKGTFGDVSQTQTGYKIELLGDGAKLQQTPLVSTLQPGCRWRFGSPQCGKDLGPLTVTGTVDTGIGQRSFVDAARAETAGFFSRGEIAFTSGDNDGISAEIKEHTAGGIFTLWPRLPYAIATGDTYSMTPGCTLLKDDADGTNGCDSWGRYDPPIDDPGGYGGFLDVPTKDKATAAANVKDPE